MRVLHCIASMGGGGAERQLAYLAGGLVARGWDVHVAFLESGPNAGRLRSSGAVIHELCLHGRSYPAGFLGLLRLIRRIRPDFVQTWLHQMDILGGLAASLRGVPFVLSERSCAAAYPGLWRDRLRLAAGRRAALLIANSDAGKAYWVSQGVEPSAVRVVRNGVPFEEIVSASADGAVALGMDPAFEWIVFAGRYSEEKSLGVLMEALWKVFEKRPNARAIFFGEGPLGGALAALRDRPRPANRVRIMGFTDGLWGAMKGARVFVSLSRFEGQPNTVLEAVACRCPVVVSDIPAHRTFLDDGSAWLVPPASVEAVAAAIRRVLEDPVLARRKAERAFAGISGYTIDAVTREYMDCLKDIVG